MEALKIRQISFETLLKAYTGLEKQYSELTVKLKEVHDENVMLYHMIYGLTDGLGDED